CFIDSFLRIREGAPEHNCGVCLGSGVCLALSDMRSSNPAQDSSAARGFTLTELLVVIAMIAVLAALVLPVLSRGKVEAVGIMCVSHLRQFSLTWLMYAHDNGDKIPPNRGSDNNPDPVVDTWVRGWLDVARPSWPDNTYTQYVRTSLLAPYLGGSL